MAGTFGGDFDLSQMSERIERNFRFRFVTRGDTANRLTALAVRALVWCHPRVRVTIVDANDKAELVSSDFPSVNLIHLPPSNDALAAHLGRATRKHLFYWRHSPEVLNAVPKDTEFVAYMDSDLLTMRPLNLRSLAEPLRRGRIGMSVDESMMSYIHTLQERSHDISRVLGTIGTGGPLLQAGLIVSHTINDGGLYDRFWQMAGSAADNGLLDTLPFDDMTILTALLTQGGALWHRWLPLGYEWNYITAQDQDPGILGAGAHYGGHRAKAFVSANSARFTAPARDEEAWGALAAGYENGHRRYQRGFIAGIADAGMVRHEVSQPFCISWRARSRASIPLRLHARQGNLGPVFVMIDGEYRGFLPCEGVAHHEIMLNSEGAAVVTLVSPVDPGLDIAPVDLWR